MGSEARAAIETVIDVIVDLARRNAALTRVFTAASLTDPEVARLRATSEADDRTMLAQTIGSLVPVECIPNPTAAALVIQLCVFEVALERSGVRPSAGPAVPDRDVKHALCEMLYRYLHPAAVFAPAPVEPSARSTRPAAPRRVRRRARRPK